MERAGGEDTGTTGQGPPGPPPVAPGAVRLRVADLDLERDFYERAVGLRALDTGRDAVRLGVGDTAVVELVPSPEAPKRPARSTGLFHLAILVPGRTALARALARVASAGWRLTGASDHLASEALYLDDPEGNGIEIYRDRPPSQWRYDERGNLRMSTLPLDLDWVLSELGGSERGGGELEPGTRIGHVHLNVADIDEAEAYYAGALGFDVTVRGYPGALFLSTGGYHHHIGVNTWAGRGAPPPPSGSRGLEWFELRVADPEAANDLGRRLERSGAAIEQAPGGLRTRDPSGNGILISAPSA